MIHWLPIEDAPKDETLIIARVAYDNVPIIVWYCKKLNEWIADTSHFNTDGNANVICTDDPIVPIAYIPIPKD